MSGHDATRLVDFTERMAHQLASLMETYGPGDWTRPWRDSGCADALSPTNAVTGRAYHGCNVWQFAGCALEQGYPTGTWATYKQWQSIGAQVRKGEKGTPGVKWAPIVRTVRDETTGEDLELSSKRLVPRWFTVFNAAQVDGYQAPTVSSGPVWEPERHADRFFGRIGADVRHGGDRAFYAPVQDYIGMPERAQFAEPAGYYATLAHEHVHWTGHPSRLGRDLRHRFGSEAYAWEELVAELGSAVLCARLGLETQPRPDHAAYLASWIGGLREQPKALLTVTAKASDAVEWLEGAGRAGESAAATDLQAAA